MNGNRAQSPSARETTGRTHRPPSHPAPINLFHRLGFCEKKWTDFAFCSGKSQVNRLRCSCVSDGELQNTNLGNRFGTAAEYSSKTMPLPHREDVFVACGPVGSGRAAQRLTVPEAPHLCYMAHPITRTRSRHANPLGQATTRHPTALGPQALATLRTPCERAGRPRLLCAPHTRETDGTDRQPKRSVPRLLEVTSRPQGLALAADALGLEAALLRGLGGPRLPAESRRLRPPLKDVVQLGKAGPPVLQLAARLA